MSANTPTPKVFTADELDEWLEQRNLKTKLQPLIAHELPLDRKLLAQLPLGPTLRSLLERRQADIIPTLRAQWAGIESEPIAALATRLLDLSPAAVIVDPECITRLPKNGPKGDPLFSVAAKAWLELRHESGDFGLFLGEPLARDAVLAALAAAEIAPQSAIAELFATFGELRDSPPRQSGNFELPSQDHDYEVDHDWQSARVIYTARNGDEVLVNALGDTAWGVLETREVRKLGRFEDLLRIYLANPMFPVLDSWSSEEIENP